MYNICRNTVILVIFILCWRERDLPNIIKLKAKERRIPERRIHQNIVGIFRWYNMSQGVQNSISVPLDRCGFGRQNIMPTCLQARKSGLAEAINRPNLSFAVSPKYLSNGTKMYIFITRIPWVVYIIFGGFFEKFIFPTSGRYLQTSALNNIHFCFLFPVSSRGQTSMNVLTDHTTAGMRRIVKIFLDLFSAFANLVLPTTEHSVKASDTGIYFN